MRRLDSGANRCPATYWSGFFMRAGEFCALSPGHDGRRRRVRLGLKVRRCLGDGQAVFDFDDSSTRRSFTATELRADRGVLSSRFFCLSGMPTLFNQPGRSLGQECLRNVLTKFFRRIQPARRGRHNSFRALRIQDHAIES